MICFYLDREAVGFLVQAIMAGVLAEEDSVAVVLEGLAAEEAEAAERREAGDAFLVANLL